MESDVSVQACARKMSSSSSEDYSKYGITDEPKHTTTTALGKAKSLVRLQTKEWVFLFMSCCNILTAIGLTSYQFDKVIRTDSESSDFTFILLLFINAAFCLFYVFHGILRERVYELYAFMAALLVVALYCILEYFAFNRPGQTMIKLIRVIVVIVMATPNIILAYIVSRGFGYLEFRIVGANKVLQNLYRQAAIFSCLLKFDLQASCSMVILVLKDGTKVSDFETISLIIGVAYSFLWSLCGWITLRRELKKCCIVFAVLGLIKPTYYLYKIIKEYIYLPDDNISTDSTIVYSLIGTVAVALFVWFMLMVELVFVYKNFGKGLRERVQSIQDQKAVNEQQQPQQEQQQQQQQGEDIVDERTKLLDYNRTNHSSSPYV